VHVYFRAPQGFNVYRESIALSGHPEEQGLSQRYPNLTTGDISFFQNVSAGKKVLHDFYSASFLGNEYGVSANYAHLFSQDASNETICY